MPIDYTPKSEKELEKFRNDIRKAKKHKPSKEEYRGLKRSVAEEMRTQVVPSSKLRVCDTGKHTIMAKRFSESPEVRAEIEQRANSLAPSCNKGAYTVITSDEMAKCAGRKL